MPQRKSKKILIYFFLLILVGSINNTSINNLKIEKVKNIYISGLDNTENKILLKGINNLNLQNIFFLNTYIIKNLIDSNSLIEKYEVRKKYPYSLDIKIKKTDFLAKLNQNGEIYLIGNNGKLSNKYSTKEDLPYIFGKPEVNEFLEFKKIIDHSKIEYQQIKSLFYFQSKRWDIKLKNNVLIKLPNDIKKNFLDSLFVFLSDKKFKNVKIIDARIKNQIIVNE
jgi:cell division protein FtsQ